MTHAKRLWSIWQALLSAFAWAFTGPSFRRFADGSPPWPSTARSTPSPSRSWPWSGPLTWKAAGILRRVRRLAPRLRHRQPDPVGRDRPRAALARLSYLGRR